MCRSHCAAPRWRKEHGVDGWRDAKMAACFDGYDEHCGTDLLGRPVLITRFGEMDQEKIFGDTDLFVQCAAS